MNKTITPWTSLIFFIILIAGSCQEEEKFVPLKLSAIEPNEVLLGDTVVIHGEGFSPDPSVNGIFFPGAARIEPFKMEPGKLWAFVPDGATSGPVTVNILDEEIATTPLLTIRTPVIDAISPEQAWVGDTITITGRNFRSNPKENSVRLVPGANVNAIVVGGSELELKVVIPYCEAKSVVKVFGFGGPEFTRNAPEISSIEPLSGVAGDTIKIKGKGLPVEGQALLGQHDALIDQLNSTPMETYVIVPANASDGLFSILQNDSYKAVSTETFRVFPSIHSIVPKSGEAGIPVTLQGSGFRIVPSENEVFFNGLKGDILSATTTQLVVEVPVGFSTGPISVDVGGRIAIGPVFTMSEVGAPIIFSVSPSSGPVGSTVLITGKNFDATSSSNHVNFVPDLSGTVLSASPTQIAVRVPTGARSGTVTVTKNGLIGIGPTFSVTTNTPIPFISSLEPAIADRSGTISIKGGNFSTVSTDIIINTLQGEQLTVLSSTSSEIQAQVPPGFPAGKHEIAVNQFAQSSNRVSLFVSSHPNITELSVSKGYPGAAVTITGTEFSISETDNVVKFNDVVASIVDANDQNPATVTAYIPDVPPGNYSITVTVGNGSNALPFSVDNKPVAVKNIYIAAKVLVSGGQEWNILKSTFDPPSVTPIYQTSNLTDIGSLAADFSNEKIYMQTSNPSTLTRANMNNTGFEELYSEAETGGLYDFTIDLQHQLIYWTGIDAKVMKGSLDGSQSSTVLYNFENGNIGYTIYGISYHAPNDMLYLIEYDATTFLPRISRISASGTGTPTMLFSDEDGLTDPRDVRVDTQHGKIFIVEGNTILSGNADGEGSLSTFVTIQEGHQLAGMAPDTQDEFLYWAEFDGSTTTQVFRKRYSGEVIPGTDPPSSTQQVHTISGLVLIKDAPTGLLIEEEGGASNRGRMSSMSLKTKSIRSIRSIIKKN